MKFGKKKNNADGGEKKKAKRKGRGGPGAGVALKNFFAEHVEKLALAAIALVSLLVIWKGLSKEPLGDTPDTVTAAVNNARNKIDASTWSEVSKTHQPESNFLGQTEQDLIQIDPAAYTYDRPFHAVLRERGKRRGDPTLLAPLEIQLVAGYGGLAIKQDTTSGETGSFTRGRGNIPGTRGLPNEMRSRRGAVSMGGNYESAYFVGILGLVPYKAQFDSFEEALLGAAMFDADRDRPRYIGLEVQRAEVADDGTLGEWQDIDTLAGMLEEPERWDGRVDEMAEQKHIIKDITMPIPPIVRRDPQAWAVHSSVPIHTRNADRGAMIEGRSEGEGRGTRSWTERRGDGGSGRTEGDGQLDETVRAQPELEVDNGMFRYFDFTVEAGKSYRYRVRALLDDPNNPLENQRPPIEALETDVVIRLQQTTRKMRATPWSDTSEIVTISKGHQVLAGQPEAVRRSAFGRGRRIVLPRRAGDELGINLLVLSWDSNGAYDVPHAISVRRGAVLNGEGDTEAIDPSIRRIRKIEAHQFRTNALVMDVTGGDPLPDRELVGPARMLVFEDGHLVIHDEFEERNDFEQNEIPPPEDEAEGRSERGDRDGEEGPRRRRG